MINALRELESVADKYGLKISLLDTTDVTMLARIQLAQNMFIQIYRNLRKTKLNMALVLGNNRIYGVDSEGRQLHEHPVEDPLSHIPIENEHSIDDFVLNCLKLLQDRELI